MAPTMAPSSVGVALVLAEYEQWRLALAEKGRASLATTKRIRALERELAGKERALAEAAALLVLTVAQRTREIGLRMALEGAPGRVRGMVLRQVAIMTPVGTLVGLAGALGVGKGAQSILFQMTGADPAVLALSAVALALVALCAGFIPAHRASRVDPMRALKYE